MFIMYTIRNTHDRSLMMIGMRRALNLALVASVLYGFCVTPYSKLRSKRIVLQHISRCVPDMTVENSQRKQCEYGIWISTLDSLSLNRTLDFDGVAEDSVLKELFSAAAPYMKDDSLYSDLPYQRLSRDKIGNGIFYKTPRDPPLFASPVHMSVLEQSYLDDDMQRRRIKLKVSGSHSIHMIFNATNIVGWSFSDELPKPVEGIVNALHQCADAKKKHCELLFEIDVLRNETLYMSISSFEYENLSSKLQSYVSRLPNWINALAFVSGYQRYHIASHSDLD